MVVYAEDEEKINKDKVHIFISYIKDNERQKPWNIVDGVDIADMTNKKIRSKILKPLMLEGVLTVTKNGNIRIRNEDLIENLTAE